MRIAVPTNNPGGLEAERSDHFGHCDVFTLIDLDKEHGIQSVATLTNRTHEAGGCLIPVKLLQDSAVNAIVVGGIGARPMQGFTEAGITVYFADRIGMPSVKEVVEGFLANRLLVMHADQVCKGSGNCQH